ncbi:MAG: ABC transporter substrate-binding protein [Neisseria sp.]|nr:ABC transporter substrate-binding protein [Neisseria sp.]
MTGRRDFLRNLISGGLLLAGCSPHDKQTRADKASNLLHRFGLPENTAPDFKRLYAAGPPAEVLLYALAPERLAGWTTRKRPQTLEMLGGNARRLPLLGGINGRGTPVSAERLLAEKIDVVIDVGVVNGSSVSTAEQTVKQLGIPYLLLEGRLAQSARQIRQLGSLIASPHTERLAALAEEALSFAQGEAAARTPSVSVYLARGRDGLETGRKNSIHTEVAALLGARSVGDALGGGGLARVSMEQLLMWQPDWVLTQDADFAAQIRRNPMWRDIRAVREGRIGLLPRLPYGWMDGPPGINRLPGIYALAAVLSGRPVSDYRERILPLLHALYHHRPNAAQLGLLGLA